MQLALDALDLDYASSSQDWDRRRVAAITALRERLAQPEWQVLTDEEINSVCHKRDWTAPWTNTNFARAIEAKLKEKNT